MRIFWDYKRAFFGLPFALPLIKGIVLVPTVSIGSFLLIQYGLTSNIYYDEYSGEAREKNKPKLA